MTSVIDEATQSDATPDRPGRDPSTPAPFVRPEVLKMLAVPAAAVAVIAALVWWSDIPLTSAGPPPGSVTMAAEPRGATLTVESLQPGESIANTVQISNPQTVQSRLSMAETAPAATVADGALRLLIERSGTVVYDGQFGAMADFWSDQGFIDPGGAVEYTFTVSLPLDADPVSADAAPVSAVYSWDTEP